MKKIQKAVTIILAVMLMLGVMSVFASAAETTTLSIPVTKVVNGTPAEQEVFNFKIEAHEDTPSAPLPTNTTLQITGANTMSFDPITFSAIGRYYYNITEVAGTKANYFYDARTYIVGVIVMRVNGALVAEMETIHIDSMQSKKADFISFTNTYIDAPVKTASTAQSTNGATGAVNSTITYKITFINPVAGSTVVVSDAPPATYTNYKTGTMTYPVSVGGSDVILASQVERVEPANKSNGNVIWTISDCPVGTYTVSFAVNVLAAAAGQNIENEGTVNFGNGPIVTNKTSTSIPKSGKLVVSKAVTGELADLTLGFTFSIELSDTTYTKSFPEGSIVGGVGTFTLYNNESVEFTDLPADTTYTIVETNGQTYTTTVNNNGTSVSGKTVSGRVLADQTATVAYTNTLKYVPIVGVMTETAPFIMLLVAGVLGAGAVVVFVRRKKETV